MGLLRSLVTGRPSPVVSAALTFDGINTADSVEVAAEAFGIYSPAATYGPPLSRVSRTQAMRVPAFRRATDLVSVLGTLPMETVKPDLTVNPLSWLNQPERSLPVGVTMARLVADLAHYGIAWWRVTAYGWDNYPAYVERLDPTTVSVMPDQRVRVTTNGNRGTSVEWPTDRELIRFEMPGQGWLTDGAEALRQCLTLDAAARRYAEGAPPGDYFEAVDGVDPFETDEEAQAFLRKWHAAGLTGSTRYIPVSLGYHTNSINPEQMQLADQRQHAVLEVARVTGIDAEELGVSVTSRTYSNQFDRRKAFLDFTLGQFRSVIEGRLSMGDVTPQGHRVRFDLDGFLRSDPLARYQAAAAGVAVGALTKPEVRAAEGRPALEADTTPEPAPEPMPTREEVPA